MRLKLASITVLILTFQFALCQVHFEEIKKGKTDKSKIDMASKIANQYFLTLKSGNYYDFKDQAIQDFKNKMTPELQKQTYLQIKQEFGDFETLTYSGSWTQKNNEDFQIIRFKGNFERTKKPLEIRVVLNSSNKVSGLWIKPWKDNLNDS